MSSDQESTQQAASEIADIVLYLFVLGPAVEWCLKSPKVNKKPASPTGLALAVALLASIAAIKLSYELWNTPQNHYATLGLRVDATSTEIKRAYRDVSLLYHPDKTKDPKAPEVFMRMQAAYEVLKDPNARDQYNRFGKPTDADGSNFTNMALFYVIWLVIGYLLTMGKASEDARTWAFSGLLALAVLEYQTRVLSRDYLSVVFPYSTINEKIELLHKLFPPFLHGSRMISGVVFRDLGQYNKMLVEQMHLKVDELGRLVHATRTELARRGGDLGGGGSSGAQLPAAVAAAVPAALGESACSGANAAAQASAAWDALLRPSPPPAAAAAGGEGASAGASSATAASSSLQGNRLMNLALFFVAYAAFKYYADKES